MADVRLGLHRRAADIDRDLALVPGLEGDDGAVKRAVRPGASSRCYDRALTVTTATAARPFTPADEARARR